MIEFGMPTYIFRCQRCDMRQEKTMSFSDFDRDLKLRCNKCKSDTEHRSVPTGGRFSCKGTGFPSTNQRLKKDRNRKSTQKKQIMVNREKSGEGVKSLGDLKKPMR